MSVGQWSCFSFFAGVVEEAKAPLLRESISLSLSARARLRAILLFSARLRGRERSPRDGLRLQAEQTPLCDERIEEEKGMRSAPSTGDARFFFDRAAAAERKKKEHHRLLLLPPSPSSLLPLPLLLVLEDPEDLRVGFDEGRECVGEDSLHGCLLFVFFGFEREGLV